ncbi:MAG TPA: nucleotidyltransferase family protein [Thermoanaerobaculia bacterium]|nr:nucleotidyltransferase family protein [Thermoanaerobaculia bacterium]
MRWVLLRAFGPIETAWNEPLDVGETRCLAGAFDLVSRIAGRMGPEALGREIGQEAADEWLRAYRLTAASNLQYAAFAGRLAGVAKMPGIPVAFLKGMALRLSGFVRLGWRAAGDIDLLVPPERLEELRAALLAEGFVSSDLPGCEHQLPPLHHPSGMMVELHRHIPGLRLDAGRGSATFHDLERAGLLERGAEVPEGSFVPAKTVLTGHCLVHGLVQHGLAPESYPPFRTVADLVDLGFAGEAEAAPESFKLDRLDAEAVGTARDLVRGLREGFDPGMVVGDSPRSRLLRHFVVGAMDERYCEALKANPRYVLTVSEKPVPLAALSALFHALFITRPEVDAIYGRQKSSAGYLFRQLMRPFDLVLRATRYSIQAVRTGLVHRAALRSKP